MTKVYVSWYGQAMFLIERPGLKILTDPFSPEIGYSFPDVEASVITVSHDHFDHNNTAAVKGNPVIIKEANPLLFGIVTFEGLVTHHDDAEGTKRGKNIMFRWELEEIVFAHMGDYGEAGLKDEQKSFLSQAHVLMIPVGGRYTIDGKQAQQVITEVNPRITIPMHYKTPALNLELQEIENFTEGLKNVKFVGGKATLEARELPDTPEIWVMDLSSG